jgi:hypothetical protein
MKLYKPLFSIIIIIIQLILSIVSYYDFVTWGKANSELDGLISRIFHGDSLFLFVLVIGFYEMQTKPSWFKTVIRILLVSIVLGTLFSGLIPIDQFYFGVYNTAWFSAVVAIVLILIRIGKYSVEKINDKNLNKASR